MALVLMHFGQRSIDYYGMRQKAGWSPGNDDKLIIIYRVSHIDWMWPYIWKKKARKNIIHIWKKASFYSLKVCTFKKFAAVLHTVKSLSTQIVAMLHTAQHGFSTPNLLYTAMNTYLVPKNDAVEFSPLCAVRADLSQPMSWQFSSCNEEVNIHSVDCLLVQNLFLHL